MTTRTHASDWTIRSPREPKARPASSVARATTTTRTRPFRDTEAERGHIILCGYACTWSPRPTFTRDGRPIFRRFQAGCLDEQLEFLRMIRSYDSVKFLVNHGLDLSGRSTPVLAEQPAVVTELNSDSTGLAYRVAFGKSVLAERTLDMIGARELRANSAHLVVWDGDPEATARPYDVLEVTRARIREFGPNTDPADRGAHILSIHGGQIDHVFSQRSDWDWPDELGSLLSRADELEERARKLTKEIDAQVAWERKPARSRGPQPRHEVSRGMVSGQRWAERGTAEREAKRLREQARNLLIKHGYTAEASRLA